MGRFALMKDLLCALRGTIMKGQTNASEMGTHAKRRLGQAVLRDRQLSRMYC